MPPKGSKKIRVDDAAYGDTTSSAASRKRTAADVPFLSDNVNAAKRKRIEEPAPLTRKQPGEPTEYVSRVRIHLFLDVLDVF
jgi:hypothetical protein